MESAERYGSAFRRLLRSADLLRDAAIRLTMKYDPPAGLPGRAVAKLLQREPNVQARRDLRRFKMLMETGEIATNAGPSGRDVPVTERQV